MSTTPTPAAKPAPKTYAVTLSGNDASAQMRVIAINRATGPIAYAQLVTRNAAGKVEDSKRGADESFKTFAEAIAYADKLVAEFLKKGWVKRTGGGGGYRSKPPAFDLKSLPAPPAAKVPAKK